MLLLLLLLLKRDAFVGRRATRLVGRRRRRRRLSADGGGKGKGGGGMRVCKIALLRVDRNANTRGDSAFRDRENWRKVQRKREAPRARRGPRRGEDLKKKIEKCERKRKAPTLRSYTDFSFLSLPPLAFLSLSSAFSPVSFKRALYSRASRRNKEASFQAFYTRIRACFRPSKRRSSRVSSRSSR